MAPIQPPRTNIGTTVPPRVPLTQPAPRFGSYPGSAAPVALPVARHEAEGAGPQHIAPDPLWISRWQPTATVPASKGPWVKAYRFWVRGVVYQSYGHPLLWNRLDFFWADHRHAYIEVTDDVYQKFKFNTASVGRLFHQLILGPKWKPGDGALFPGFPL